MVSCQWFTPLLYENAKDPRSSIYSAVQGEGDTVPTLIRKQVIDLFCLQNRCQEELGLLNVNWMIQYNHIFSLSSL